MQYVFGGLLVDLVQDEAVLVDFRLATHVGHAEDSLLDAGVLCVETIIEDLI